MTKYIVKVVYVATDDNPSFKGETSVEYVGKNDTQILVDSMNIPSSYYVKNYGYNRKCDAMRNYTFKHCQDFCHKWFVKSKAIIEVEV